jgi:DNA polymerase II
MSEVTGWLFDLYPHPQKGFVIWIIDEKGNPHCFHQDFEITFYASGPFPRLRELWRFLLKRDVNLVRVTRKDVFDGAQEVMQIQAPSHGFQRKLFKEVQEHFSDLTFYDVDIVPTIRYAAAYNVFMMCYCRVTANLDGRISSIHALDTPGDLDPELPPLRILRLKPDVDPSHANPRYLIVHFGKSYMRLCLEKSRQLITVLNGIIQTYDPDVIQTRFGDSWLFPILEERSQQLGIAFSPNRDPTMPVLHRKEVSFFNYGQAHYRAPQVQLRGRWHVDVENGTTYNQYQLNGAIEQVRLSSLPLQEVARRSLGAAIAAMQDLSAIRNGFLVPYEHQKGEIPKSYNQLIRADRGGLVFIPKPGIYKNVAILDFSSMMASLMIEFNVSPETVVSIDEQVEGFEIPELGVKIIAEPGLVPQTLRPMRDKRLALKKVLRKLDKTNPQYNHIRETLKPVVDGIKWLTVVCYGRLGFANSRFGRINAHEVVSYLSRRAVTQAKTIAETKGFEVLHLYVDSIFVSRPDATQEDFQALAREIEENTRLPMDFDGTVFPWFAFLSSRSNSNVGVANRFYGLSPDGEHKLRGIALRRRDTPLFVSYAQMKALAILGREPDPSRLADLIPEVLGMLRKEMQDLKEGTVPLDELVLTHKLSREPEQFSVLSPSAAVCRQLKALGREMKRGQHIRFIYIAAAPGVWAWDSPKQPNPSAIDRIKYRELLIRGVEEVLQPIGVTENILRTWLISGAGYLAPPGFLKATDQTRLAVPLLAGVNNLRL